MNDTMHHFNGIFIGSIVIFVVMFIAALVVMILMLRKKDGGERFELQVAANLVGLICEGDYGTVTVQGTECVQFDRR